MWNGVGGGTVVYAAHWQRNMPSDFRVRTLDGVADDWPLTYEDLEPYYVRVERDWGVSGLAGDTGFPGGEGPPMPPVPLGEMGRRVARAHNELGWHWWPAPNAIATRPYGALNLCVQRATCLRACADGAKATVDSTYWPENERTVWSCGPVLRVRRLLLGPTASSREPCTSTPTAASTCSGPRSPSSARTASAPPACCSCRRENDGLANSSGLVGKRLMIHPFGTVTGLFEDDLESWNRARGASTSTRSSSTRPTTRATSCAEPSGGCSRPAVRSR